MTDDERVLDLALLVAPRAAAPRSATGLLVYARASSPTSPSSVAENSIVWRVARQPADDPVDLRLEAHVEHPVGLVEDEGADPVERDHAGARSDPAGDPGVAIRMWASRARLAWLAIGAPP